MGDEGGREKAKGKRHKDEGWGMRAEGKRQNGVIGNRYPQSSALPRSPSPRPPLSVLPSPSPAFRSPLSSPPLPVLKVLQTTHTPGPPSSLDGAGGGWKG
jgi:hypothetical protein